MELSVKDWQLISEMILSINAIQDLDKMRMSLLEKLDRIISFDSSNIFIGYKIEGSNVLKNPVLFKHPYNKVADPQSLVYEYSKYQNVDFTQWMFSLPCSTVYRDTDLLSDSIRENTDIYKRIYKPIGIHYCVGIVIVYNSQLLGTLNLYRYKESGDFSDRDLSILRFVEPHLTLRMFQLHPEEKNQRVIRNTLMKEYGLTAKEYSILDLIRTGMRNSEIATALFISEETVKKHLSHIYAKTNVSNRSKLVKLLMEKRLEFHPAKQ